MDKEKFILLLDKYLKGEASLTEKNLIEEYYRKLDEKESTLLSEMQEEQLKAEIFVDIQQRVENFEQHQPLSKSRKLWFKRMAAASVLLLIGAALYWHYTNGNLSEKKTAASNNVPAFTPGNKAILTIGNGSKIVLTNENTGLLAKQSGTNIFNAQNGQLVYTNASREMVDTGSAVLNTVTTPRGGQYRLTLQDGTKIWLNAASSLTYPTYFAGKERKVVLNGEAYFEVTHDKAKPFEVLTENQKVEVLGTHFDISAYADEPTTKTTLLEGSVKVSRLNASDSKILKPGQQSILGAVSFQIQTTDIESETDWKDGYFIFNKKSLHSIMDKISRWYNVDVSYDVNVEKSNLEFGGIVSRSDKLVDVLKMMERTGEIHFRQEGNNITVLR